MEDCMDAATARLEALKLAAHFNFAVGVACPGCAAELASKLEKYITTGEIAQVTHFDQQQDATDAAEPANEGFQLLSFDPAKKPN
jgi:hypothetical protein